MNQYEWWIDYLEGEVTTTERLDMDVLLKFSTEHRSVLTGLEKTRDCLKRLDPVSPPSGEPFYAGLHSAIMSRLDENLIEEDKIAPVAPGERTSYQKRES